MIQPIHTIEMHTGGEPLRIVRDGVPLPDGMTLLERRRYLRDQADHYRKFLMFEPRGHRDMYGAILVPPDDNDADFGVIFLHNEGYSTMCGHAIIALGRYAVDSGLVKKQDGEVPVNIQCPCGLVRARVHVTNGQSGAVSFHSVPSFALRLNQFVDTRDYGPVELDIGYGGAFYGILDAGSLGLDLGATPTTKLVEAADHLSQAIREQINIEHPTEPDLSYLYGIIFTDGQDGRGGSPSTNICVFADGQVDRSPTGSGVTARLAVAAAHRRAEPGETFQFESITGAVFSGTIVGTGKLDRYSTVTVEVSGRAHYCGKSEFTMENDDMLAGGFLIR
ncbi:proline racemase family protein [Sneathiella chinensis]|uniref:Proline racemase n=1 Tax=Sneathiella chinensis TaxID=349750 RepID=A0ABQ5U0D6_9PROT|nr:proline racemase family protein [Sneathiella chinensis]GLQ05614.1 proline racemase [Sneathiella chinensis]